MNDLLLEIDLGFDKTYLPDDEDDYERVIFNCDTGVIILKWISPIYLALDASAGDLMYSRLGNWDDTTSVKTIVDAIKSTSKVYKKQLLLDFLNG